MLLVTIASPSALSAAVFVVVGFSIGRGVAAGVRVFFDSARMSFSLRVEALPRPVSLAALESPRGRFGVCSLLPLFPLLVRTCETFFLTGVVLADTDFSARRLLVSDGVLRGMFVDALPWLFLNTIRAPT